jgi:hypothetical protein
LLALFPNLLLSNTFFSVGTSQIMIFLWVNDWEKYCYFTKLTVFVVAVNVRYLKLNSPIIIFLSGKGTNPLHYLIQLIKKQNNNKKNHCSTRFIWLHTKRSLNMEDPIYVNYHYCMWHFVKQSRETDMWKWTLHSWMRCFRWPFLTRLFSWNVLRQAVISWMTFTSF